MKLTTEEIAAAFGVPMEIVEDAEPRINLGAELDAIYRDFGYSMQPWLELAVKARKEDEAG